MTGLEPDLPLFTRALPFSYISFFRSGAVVPPSLPQDFPPIRAVVMTERR